jgi:hypothetical protein
MAPLLFDEDCLFLEALLDPSEVVLKLLFLYVSVYFYEEGTIELKMETAAAALSILLAESLLF